MSVAKSYFSRSFLHNVQKYKDAVIGIKLSGKCLEDMATRRDIVRQVLELRTLGSNVVLIHGGGKQITAEAEKAGIVKDERAGLRYTTQPELAIMERCIPELTGTLVGDFNHVSKEMGLDAKAIGLNGFDGKMVKADLHSPLFEGSRTGKVTDVNGKALRSLMKSHIVVMNSICAGEDGGHWNVNADDVIEGVARVTKAKLVIMCSDTPLYDKKGNTIRTLFTDSVEKLYANGTFGDKIKPKVDSAVKMAEEICPVAILDGRIKSVIDRELYNKTGGGTRVMVRPAEPTA
jgi:acetylglutamate kinase